MGFREFKCPNCAEAKPVIKVFTCNGCDQIIPDAAAVPSAAGTGKYLCPDCDCVLQVKLFCTDCEVVFDHYGRREKGYKWRVTFWQSVLGVVDAICSGVRVWAKTPWRRG